MSMSTIVENVFQTQGLRGNHLSVQENLDRHFKNEVPNPSLSEREERSMDDLFPLQVSTRAYCQR